MYKEVTIYFPENPVTFENVQWILFKGPFVSIVLENGDEHMYPHKEIERIVAIKKDGK
jgi:hypothetical protein